MTRKKLTAERLEWLAIKRKAQIDARMKKNKRMSEMEKRGIRFMRDDGRRES